VGQAFQPADSLERLSHIRRVQRGERIFITHHGDPVALLTPVEPAPAQPVQEVIAAVKAFRRGRSLGFPLKDLIDEGRL